MNRKKEEDEKKRKKKKEKSKMFKKPTGFLLPKMLPRLRQVKSLVQLQRGPFFNRGLPSIFTRSVHVSSEEELSFALVTPKR